MQIIIDFKRSGQRVDDCYQTGMADEEVKVYVTEDDGVPTTSSLEQVWVLKGS